MAMMREDQNLIFIALSNRDYDNIKQGCEEYDIVGNYFLYKLFFIYNVLK